MTEIQQAKGAAAVLREARDGDSTEHPDPIWDGTEDAIALEFSELHWDLRYVAQWGKWFRWNGSAWVEDTKLIVFDLIRQYCRDSMVYSNDNGKRVRAAKPATVNGIEQFVRADQRQAATIDLWDQDQWLLNTPAGIVDLRTGELGEHRPEAHMTKITAIGPGGDCPRWRQFLGEITDQDVGLIDFLQRLIGYCLTGSTTEHVLAFCYGTGANGKGVFLNSIRGLMADYARAAPMEAFAESQTDRHPTELAMLRGARLVVSQETEQGKRWAESRIKSLTGGDPVPARFMRQDFFEYTPQFKLLISGNHRPQLRNVDEAMRRRLLLIPFNRTFGPEERDKDLGDKLKAEWPGILQWAVEGCVAYLADGLRPPEAVRVATEAYFRTQDALGTWVEECCDVGPNHWEPPKRLFESWRRWTEEANEHVGGSRTFGDALEKAGYPRARIQGGTRVHRGLRLKFEEARDG